MTKDTKIKLEFARFLIKHKCLKKYLDNCLEHKFSHTEPDAEARPGDMVVEAFSWNRTEEGHNFWCDRSVEWRKWLEKPDLIELMSKPKSKLLNWWFS